MYVQGGGRGASQLFGPGRQSAITHVWVRYLVVWLCTTPESFIFGPSFPFHSLCEAVPEGRGIYLFIYLS
jgi:hypothetical protein